MTRHPRRLGWLVAFGGFCLATATAKVNAHHSFAMYDQTTTKTMTGTLVRLIPGGSHSQIVFDVMDAEGKPAVGPDGKPVKWQVELGSAANIARQGVTVKTMTPGTVITVTFFRNAMVRIRGRLPVRWCSAARRCQRAGARLRPARS